MSGVPVEAQRRLAEHAGVPFVTLERGPQGDEDYRQVHPDVRRLLPSRLCRRLGMLPIGIEDDAVVIACAEPVQYLPYDVAAALGGRPVSFVVAPADQLARALERAPVSPNPEDPEEGRS